MENMQVYIPILMIFVIALGLGIGMVVISRLAGKNRPTAVKLMPYECGENPVGTARDRFSVKFYLVAMVFLLFDIEIIFLVPWAVVYNELSAQYSKWLAYGEMMIFIVILFVGYLYIWRKGVFDWSK